MKYLITGSSGQLARAFIARFDQQGLDYVAPSEDVFDITDKSKVDAVLDAAKADVVINCAAYNAVDAAEHNSALAFRVNSEAVGFLAAAALRHGAKVIHYGSDYAFDGATQTPYVEDDKPAPLNVYGESKLAGERVLLESHPGSLVFRVSWVYGNGCQNFFHKMMQWSETTDVLKIVWDQLSVPTYTEDIVTFTLAALEQGLSGLYHLPNSGYASRYEVARYFFKCLGKEIVVIPVSTDVFPSPARRPFFSAMSNAKLSKALGQAIPLWEDGVQRFVARIDH